MSEIDWTKSMEQTFEFYSVDPSTWNDVLRIDSVLEATISWDSSNETLGGATITTTEELDEIYVRIYLVAIQEKITRRFCLGTFLVQTPSLPSDGKMTTIELDAYTPLLELKDDSPEIGYTVTAGNDIYDSAYQIIRERCRAPVVEPIETYQLSSNFTANLDDTWLSFLSDFLACANAELTLDETCRIVISPKRDLASIQAVWAYVDDNSSILYPDASDTRDLYGIPNAYELIWSNESTSIVSRAENTDDSSPISIPSRGRIVLYRNTSPDIDGTPTQAELDALAEQGLRDLSMLEHELSYSHGYNGVRLGQAIRLNYARANIEAQAVVSSQTITCTPGCKVEETAIYTENLWRQ